MKAPPKKVPAAERVGLRDRLAGRFGQADHNRVREALIERRAQSATQF